MTSILHHARGTTELTQLTHLYTVTDAAQVIPIIRSEEAMNSSTRMNTHSVATPPVPVMRTWEKAHSQPPRTWRHKA